MINRFALTVVLLATTAFAVDFQWNDCEQNLPLNTDFKLVINKTLVIGQRAFDVTLPCIDGMGSCQMKVCDLFHLWYNDILCPFFKSSGKTCACPVEKATFARTNVPIDVPFNKWKGFTAKLADGDYSIRFTMFDPLKPEQHYACLDIKTHLTVRQ
ncbi:hypothetical protein RDWZM_004522 [Blomia tropicalis]|uniref:MD-2-related lipid-recognition domain-containing protein n=1 Tax=Blomia tropicalis TaxID=40697 RepID=A0A9Q0RLQ3_BLOTA|nr:hypothetical protein RDWZM_004522 [Blomia tropicalis]